MEPPASILPHSQDYVSDAWKQYTVQELGNWVHLLVKRAGHRTDPEKRKKDLHAARNYFAMMDAHIADAEVAVIETIRVKRK